MPTDRNVLVESLPARTGGSSCTSSVNGGIGKLNRQLALHDLARFKSLGYRTCNQLYLNQIYSNTFICLGLLRLCNYPI